MSKPQQSAASSTATLEAAPLDGHRAAESPHSEPTAEVQQETAFEGLASICSILVIGIFILTFLGQNFVIPSGSMEKTLLVGDHLAVDRITLAPKAGWMPLVHYRLPRRGDIVVFLKPGELENGEHPYLVKRLIGVPGDRIHLRDGIVILNGVAQNEPQAQKPTPDRHDPYVDDFPSVSPWEGNGVTAEWAVDLPSHMEGDDLVVPPGHYFMMGDNRENSLDSRYWGFVPQANIIGRPLFNYWSFVTPDEQIYKTSLGDRLGWMAHVVTHFLSDTRWKRTLHPVR